MENKDLLELAKLRMDHFEKTRSYEFKINVALWTLIVLVGKFGFGKIPQESFPFIIYIVYSLLIIICHFAWMTGIQKSQDKDLEFKIACDKEIFKNLKLDKESEISKHIYNNDSKRGMWGQYKWIFCEVGFTALLLLGLPFVLFRSCSC